MNLSTELKKLIHSRKTLVMPDAYDPLSAKIIEISGFQAVQCSGYSYSIAALKKNEFEISRKHNIESTSKIVETVKIPVMADAEDGYGDSETVKETVKLFMDAGVAGINIEDQIASTTVNSITTIEKMVDKIEIARKVANRQNSDFIINGRTDALKTKENREEALNIAIERSNIYLRSGADLTFVAYVETLEEVEMLKKEIKGPLSIAAGMPYNIQNFNLKDLIELNVERISFPTIMIHSSIIALSDSLNNIKNDTFKTSDTEQLNKNMELNSLLNSLRN